MMRLPINNTSATRLNKHTSSHHQQMIRATSLHPRVSVHKFTISTSFVRTMSQSNGAEEGAPPPRKLKILMLHGYTQSGPSFHSKTRALEKLLHKAFPASPKLNPLYPGGITLLYPTAPIHLLPADIPGFSPSSSLDDKPDAWGWWKRETGSLTYAGLEDGLRVIADTIREMGGIDGVVGFSQGAAAAGMVASLLQPGRQENFSAYASKSAASESIFPYPESWKGLPELHPHGVRFAVSYSGFLTPNKIYNWMYVPKLSAPVLHVLGTNDTVVDEERSLAFVNACEKGTTVYHPGGHFVPIGKEMGGVLVGFIRGCLEEKKEEEKVQDMELPF